MLELRPYQRESLDGLWSYWDRVKGSPLIVAPTGSGKSVLIATFIRETREKFPRTRFLIATHVKELIAQNFSAMLCVWPTAPAGIYSAGLGQRSIGQPIVFCGIQSVYARPEIFGHVDLLLVDECHLIPKKSDTMYGRFIAGLRKVNPALKVVGFTATPYRLDSGRLDRGDTKIFDGIAFDIGIQRLVDEGHLAPLVSKATETALDVSGVKKRGGEFIEGELQKAVDRQGVTEAAVAEIAAYGVERRSWLCFCAGVDHARHVAEALVRRGVNAAFVHGGMQDRERDRVIAAFKSGAIRAVANANLLTTGFDHPPLDLIALLRPTMSTGLYVQMLGRGMRPSPGKDNCLVLDFARNIARHGPVDMVTAREPGEGCGGGVAPTKECPECRSILHAACRICPDCGYQFPFRTADDKIEATASRAAVMARDLRPEWVPVTGWSFHRHTKQGGTETLRVEYRSGISVYREWLCFNHAESSFPKLKADRWWRAHDGALPAPSSVVVAAGRAASELACPSEILVRRVDKYFEVASRRFAANEEAA